MSVGSSPDLYNILNTILQDVAPHSMSELYSISFTDGTSSVSSGTISLSSFINKIISTSTPTYTYSSGFEWGYYNDNYHAGGYSGNQTWFDTRTPVYTHNSPGRSRVTDFTNISTASSGQTAVNGDDTYSYLWTGYFKAPITSTYYFNTRSDDNSHMWVGTSALSPSYSNETVDNGGLHGMQTVTSAGVSLTGGVYYDFRMTFGEEGGGDDLQAQWRNNSTSFSYDWSTVAFSNRQISSGVSTPDLLRSKGLTGTQGYTLYTNVPSKDMGSTSARAIPSGYNPSSGSLTPSGTRYYWSDWSGDIFDGWGDFYIYNPSTTSATYITFASVNGGDGTIYTETQTHHGKSFTIKHGWVTQGIFKLDVECSDDTFDFSIGMYGNMGSDGNTQNTDRQYSASWGTLSYNYNSQSGTSEWFYSHCIPKLKTFNDGITLSGSNFTSNFRTSVYGNDYLAIWTDTLTWGATFYFVKGSNSSSGAMYNWVENDIELVPGSSGGGSTINIAFHYGTFSSSDYSGLYSTVSAATTAGHVYSDSPSGTYSWGTLGTPSLTSAGTTYTWTPTTTVTGKLLMVAGGGGGGGTIAGGGGAGGVVYYANQSLSGTKTIVVGNGGAGGYGWDYFPRQGSSGTNTTFTGLTTAIGGGGGGGHGYSTGNVPQTGGSGGGGAQNVLTGASGTAGQGNAGGNAHDGFNYAGGGGGAGGAGGTSGGSSGGIGGIGIDYSSDFGITYGDSGWFASGGGGGVRDGSSRVGGTASIGGGGNGNNLDSGAYTAAQKHTGGGGGGGGFAGGGNFMTGGVGGSGIVLFKESSPDIIAFHYGTFSSSDYSGLYSTVSAATTAGHVYSDSPSGTYTWGTLGTPSLTSTGTTYTWTPSSSITGADVLMVAGGGGGGGVDAGGGGAGGVVYYANQSLSGTKTIVVGNGGAGGIGWNNGNPGYGSKGKDTTFTGLTTAIGGGGGGNNGFAFGESSVPTNRNGGSGGGADGWTGYNSNGIGTTGQGNNGGTGMGASPYSGGGGGGAGGVGGTGTSSNGGSGGIGLDYSSDFGITYGDSGWFASGGGGGSRTSDGGTPGTASQGGGTSGSGSSTPCTDAQNHTGGGGGGGSYSGDSSAEVGARGGSGIILIKY